LPVQEAVCAYCQRPFTFYHAPSTKAQRYCSVKCRGRAMSQARQGWKFPVENTPADHQPPPQSAIERDDEISS
jgi:hypothetical protein